MDQDADDERAARKAAKKAKKAKKEARKAKKEAKKELKGEELKGKQYTPPFAYFESRRATGAFRAPASHPKREEQ